jgi:hypothetical protein
MKNIMGALLVLPLVITATAMGGDVFTDGDQVLGNVAKTKPAALVERFDPNTGERKLFDASALSKLEDKSESALAELVSKNSDKLKEMSVVASAAEAKDKPTTAWCGRYSYYYVPYVYNTYYYYDYYAPRYYTYFYTTYTTWTYTYYNNYYYTYYRW